LRRCRGNIASPARALSRSPAHTRRRSAGLPGIGGLFGVESLRRLLERLFIPFFRIFLAQIGSNLLLKLSHLGAVDAAAQGRPQLDEGTVIVLRLVVLIE